MALEERKKNLTKNAADGQAGAIWNLEVSTFMFYSVQVEFHLFGVAFPSRENRCSFFCVRLPAQRVYYSAWNNIKLLIHPPRKETE